MMCWLLFGNKNKAMICGKGSISAPRILELKNVLFVDVLKENLISISQICDEICLTKFNHKECTMYDSTKMVIVKRIKLKDKCYHMGDSRYLICNRNNINVEKLWHQILCHVNYKSLNKILSLEIVKGLNSITILPDQYFTKTSKKCWF